MVESRIRSVKKYIRYVYVRIVLASERKKSRKHEGLKVESSEGLVVDARLFHC
jgi:hypothetical protein